MSRRHVLLGITGGIGSGKSHVASILAGRMGIPVYYCDRRAKELNDSDEGIRSRLTELVGKGLYDGGRLVRPVLAGYLFACGENARKVADIVHPVVKDDFMRWVGNRTEEVLAVESAILYDSGFDSLVDYVIFVDAPAEVRISRAMKRDGCMREQIEARMAMQQTADAMAMADFVLLNEGRNDVELECELTDIVSSIRNKS